MVSYRVIRSGYYPEWRENERIGVIMHDTTWCHKGVSLKGYHWISDHENLRLGRVKSSRDQKKSIFDRSTRDQRSIGDICHTNHQSEAWERRDYQDFRLDRGNDLIRKVFQFPSV